MTEMKEKTCQALLRFDFSLIEFFYVFVDTAACRTFFSQCMLFGIVATVYLEKIDVRRTYIFRNILCFNKIASY